MKTIYKLCICVSLYSILLTACTALEDGEPGFHAEEGQLLPVQAQVLTDIVQTRSDLAHTGGDIRIEAYGKTCRYELFHNGNIDYMSSNAITMPRTSVQAVGLTAYGQVGIISASGSPYALPVHAAPADYPVTWDITNPDNPKAYLDNAIELTPAVAVLNISLQDAEGGPLTGFKITTQGIYQNASPNYPDNWQKDPNGIYQIKPSEILATGEDREDIYIVSTTLTPGPPMLSITDGPGAYNGKTWTANVPFGLSLEAGNRYNLTITLNTPGE